VTDSAAALERAIEEVKRLSSIDPSFRALAIEKPMEALAKVHPHPIPAGLTLVFTETVRTGGGRNARIVILPAAQGASEELSDSELEDVAGGSDSAGSGMSGGW
jgi:hypothetical protein